MKFATSNGTAKEVSDMARKSVYWVCTVLLAILYLGSATIYATKGDMVRTVFSSLGYPSYLVPLLIAAKGLGVAAILIRIRVGLSDLAYAGMFYHLLLAFSAHLHAGDGGFAAAIAGLCLLAGSFYTQNAARHTKSPYSPVAPAAAVRQ